MVKYLKLYNLAKYNSWWKYGSRFVDYDADFSNMDTLLDRRLIDVNVGNVYVLRGIRRSGKTVYVKLLIKRLIERGVDSLKILYIPCDKLVSRRELRSLIYDFLGLNPVGNLYIVLDEVTYLPEWYLVVKEFAESRDIDRMAIIATGSNPRTIKEKTERLPGRRIEGNEYYARTLSFREFVLDAPITLLWRDRRDIEALRRILIGTKFDLDYPDFQIFKKLMPFLDVLDDMLRIYLVTGGFPRTIIDYLKNGKIDSERYEEIIRLILGDISKMRRSERIALGVLRMIVDKPVQRIDFSTIGRELDVHIDTVRDIIELLEDSSVILTLMAWDIDRRAPYPRRLKKFLLMDPFLFSALKRYLYGLDFEDMLIEIDKNREFLVEMLVTSTVACHKEIPHLKERWSFLGYYYDRWGEIDCVYFGKKPIGIEVKYGERLPKRKHRIDVIYATRDEFNPRELHIPVAMLLASMEKSNKVI